MKWYQYNCYEGKDIDLRQAKAVSKYKPDIILFEAPNYGKTPGTIYNVFKPKNKPLKNIDKHKQMLRRVSKTAPWVLSDIYVYDNILTLWKKGHDIKLYNIDGPRELLKINLNVDLNKKSKPERRGTNLMWWVRIYLREKIMTKNVNWILTHSNTENDKVALAFIQKFHWKNIQFQLKNPSKNKMWNYYFGDFKDLTPKNINSKIKTENKQLYKYWKRLSDFN